MDEPVDAAVAFDGPAAARGAPRFEDGYEPLLEHAYWVGLRFFGRDHHMAQEVAQETLSRAYERWASVSRHPRPEAWIMNAAWKVSQELQRKRARGLPYHVVEESGSGDDHVVQRPVLTDALRKLTTRQRTVIIARYYFGYDVGQSAELLGMSSSQVKTATHEAARKLRGLLEDDPEVTS